MEPTDRARAATASPFLPIYVAMFGCIAAMTGFVALAGSLAEVFGLRPWHIGITVTVSGLAWVLGSRPWGSRSDRVGRRPVMIQGAVIFLFFYLAMVAAIGLGQIWGLTGLVMLAALVLVRSGLGLGFAALPPAANAYVADHTAPADRAGEMGRLGASQALGMIAGPAMVSLLAWAGLVVPLLVLALAPIVALVVLYRGLNEAPVARSERREPLSLTDPRLRRISSIAAAAMFCVGIAQISVSFIMLDRFDMSPAKAAQFAGLGLTAVGMALIPAQLLVPRLGWTPRILIQVGALLAALGFAGSAFAPQAGLVLASYAVSGFGMGWVFAAVFAQAANSVGAEEQGRAAGTVSAAQGVGAMLGPLCGALIYSLNGAAPYLLCTALLLGVSLLAAQLPVGQHDLPEANG